jgi:hypothetical protein
MAVSNQESRSDGLKVTISAFGNGLTVNKQGRPLLPRPFVFQCPPLEQFTIAHQQNFGTYDTIDDDQYSRRGSRQLDTWSFDTLAMYLGVDAQGRYEPSWVPYPTRESHGLQYQAPEWYRKQLWDLHDAGSPFRFVAAFKRSTTIRRTYATLTAFNEDYKHGEGDVIYFSAVSFQEWRDPGDASQPKPRGSDKLPAHVRFRFTGGRYLAYDTETGRTIPARGGAGTTMNDLARFYYGNASDWRLIAKANHLRGGSGLTQIYKHWYPHRISRGKPNATMTIPKQPHKPSPARTAPAKAK